MENIRCSKCDELFEKGEKGSYKNQCVVCYRKHKSDYYIKNKEGIKLYKLKYSRENKDKVKACQARYNKENQNKIKLRRWKYRQDNKEKINVYGRFYNQGRKDYRKQYDVDNKEKIMVRARLYRRRRRSSNPLYRLRTNVGNRISKAINRIKIRKTYCTMELVGCSLDKLKKHLEIQFIKGMTWDNYGKWHVDHIIPLSFAGDKESLFKLMRYTNLQPLWARDNIRKSDNI